jgi:murein DD-endopeptidase MepM/ murein hydrolase activator NlpD
VDRIELKAYRLAVLLLVAAGHLASGTQAKNSWRVSHQPATLVNGSPVLFTVRTREALASLEASWLEHQIRFRLDRGCGCWYAVAGVPLNTPAALYTLELEGTTASGQKVSFSDKEVISEARYPSTAITVAPEYVQPPRETLARIEEEQTLKKRVFSETSPEPLWSGRFQSPAPAATSGVFGAARVFNGVKKSQHEGIDYRVHTGTPIDAANAGAVILARNLYFEGNCVAIDHGQGLISVYLHLSKFMVKEGDHVKRGQVIGLSGGTGRATAPHLHFAVRWQGSYLNPATLLKLTPP